jgi:YbbR domain-containing protein
MKNIKSSDVRVYVDLDKAKKGEETYFINKDDIKLPYAMSAENVTPSSLKVKLDETVSKPVPVKPVITGVPENGFHVKSIEVEPRNVIIHGLKTEVRKVKELKTETLDITGLNENITEDLKIEAAGVNIRPEVTRVRTTVVVEGKKK